MKPAATSCIPILACSIFFLPSHGAPTNNNKRDTSSRGLESHVILPLTENQAVAFLWTSIALAVFTAFIQGLVTALSSMTEFSDEWTFRFRLATIEHWWWTSVSFLLSSSLVFSILYFLAGNTQDAVSILLLSSTTFLAIVRYMLPAWRSRHYLQNRYLAWTGPSRTGIEHTRTVYCGGEDHWRTLAKLYSESGDQSNRVPSDSYGWHLRPVPGVSFDPTDILRQFSGDEPDHRVEDPQYIYNDGYPDSNTVSLLWGSHSGFRPRVSRSVTSVPINLLKSQPLTVDGFSGRGLCLAMGILGRNKGTQPRDLVFSTDRGVAQGLETNSTWRPRPSKTMRSYYKKVIDEVYGGLGSAFVGAAVELSLVLMDVPPAALAAWLKIRAEHQVHATNRTLSTTENATVKDLRAHYRSSYVSMFISLNNMKTRQTGQKGILDKPKRPEIICLGLLLRAEGEERPAWWNEDKFAAMRLNEANALGDGWESNAARLLGLPGFPGHATRDNNYDLWADGEPPATENVVHEAQEQRRNENSRPPSTRPPVGHSDNTIQDERPQGEYGSEQQLPHIPYPSSGGHYGSAIELAHLPSTVRGTNQDYVPRSNTAPGHSIGPDSGAGES